MSARAAVALSALLLSLARKVPLSNKLVQSGRWEVPPITPLHRIDGQVLGLVGFGNIPRALAPKAKSFGLRVVTHDPYVSPEILATAAVEDASFDALLGMSDFISVHAPLLPATRGLINADAFLWLREDRPAEEKFDAVIIDLPDPSNFSIGKLYSLTFYRLLKSAVKPDSLIVIQSTSPLIARKSFWCVDNTLEAAGYQTAAYHLFVPSFGEWGFIIGSRSAYHPPDSLPEGLRFLSPADLLLLFNFPLDMARVPTEVNRLSNQVLVQTFEDEWGKVHQ